LEQQNLHSIFTALVKEHERVVYKICYMYADSAPDRQDLYQEVMLQLWKSYPAFRGEAKFSTWLYQVALNTAIAGLRKSKRSIVDYTDADLPDMADTGRDTEQLDLLHRAIARLNQVEKAIVMLYLENKTYDEMQEVMGIPNGALRVKMTRIKDKLRDITKQ